MKEWIFVIYSKSDELIFAVDEDGIEYNGVRVQDAGEAQKAFVGAMKALNPTK